MKRPGKKAAFVVGALALMAVAVLAYFVWRAESGSGQAKVPANVPATWAQVKSSPGHTGHLDTKKPAACADCHDESNGKFTLLGDTACAKCHDAEVKRTHAGTPGADHATTCTTCHAFGTKAAPSCISCHAEAQGKQAAVAVHASKDAPCASCHATHRDPPVKQADCATCHAKVKASHGAQHVESDVAKARGWLDASAATTGPSSAPGDAGKAIFTSLGAVGIGAPECTDCHAPHTKAAAATTTCTGCHTAAPKGAHPSSHAACTTCHKAHDLGKTAVVPCAGCHQNKSKASLSPGHAACTTCHTPHDTPAKKGVCAACHANQHTLAESRVPKHAECASCHAPHDPKASAAAACVTCHASVSSKHAPGKADRCIDCHTPHPKAGAKGPLTATLGSPAHPSPAQACATCHTKAKSDDAFHARGIACTNCHEPHAFSLKAGPALCQKCHAAEQRLVAKTTGHADCLQCHGSAHAPAQQKATCATCHKAEATTAPKGHAACNTCHETHAGAIKPAAALCKSCHAKEGASAHARVVSSTSAGLNGACNTCHRPHGPSGTTSPPACTTCHSLGSLPSLHRVGVGASARSGGHTSCATCHSAHDPAKAARADRATCITCHADKKDHQPDAKVCSGCHIFRK